MKQFVALIDTKEFQPQKTQRPRISQQLTSEIPKINDLYWPTQDVNSLNTLVSSLSKQRVVYVEPQIPTFLRN